MNPGSVESLERRLTQLDELRRQDGRASIARVASTIGHLVGTPLNVIAGRAALIRANPEDAVSVAADAARIEKQVEQLAVRIRALIEFLAVPETPPVVGTVGALLLDVVELYEPIARSRGIAVEHAVSSADAAVVDRNLALCVLTNLVSLVAHEAPPNTRLAVGATHVLDANAPGAGFVRFSLLVPGMNVQSPQRLHKIEGYESIPATRLNSLQVLSVSSAMADRVGGRLDVVFAGDGSAEITLLWPCCV
jgi:two-component system, NtrC family, sensor kinase